MSEAHTLFYKLYKDCELKCRGGNKPTNVDNKPNFHVGVHWEWYIRMYGMPCNYDSERHENKHQDPKHDMAYTTGRADACLQLIQSEKR